MSHLASKKGSAIVEMAFSIMILLLIVFGIFEFGRAMYITNTLNNAARYGARLAVVSTKTILVDDKLTLNVEAIKTEIKNHVQLGLADLKQMEINIDPTSPMPGSSVKVTTRLPFVAITPIICSFFPSGFRLQGEASMRYEL